MIPEYIYNVAGHEKQLNTSKETPNLINPITEMAEKILNTRIDKLTRNDVESFVKQIYKLDFYMTKELTVLDYNENQVLQRDEIVNAKYSKNRLKDSNFDFGGKDKGMYIERDKIRNASLKILEKEKMSLAKSYTETSAERHKKNYLFVETFMKIHGLDNSREFFITEDLRKMFKKLTKKDITSITSEDIDKVVLLANKLSLIYDNEIEYESKIRRSESKFKQHRIVDVSIVPLISKLIDREEIALDNSFFEEAKERHRGNIRAIKFLITPIDWPTS